MGPRIALSALVSFAVISSVGQSMASHYCTDYNPSIQYLNVTLPEKLRLEHIPDGFDEYRIQNPEMAKNLPPYARFSVDAIKYASINNFIEQLAIGIYADRSPFLKRLNVMALDKAVIDAMGLGVAGTRIVEPGAGLPNVSDLDIQVVDIEGVDARSDTPNYIFLSRDLMKQVVENAVDRHFGGLQGYEEHLKRILALFDEVKAALVRLEPTNYQNFVNFRVDGQDNSRFPIGQVINNAAEAAPNNPFKQTRAFAIEVVGELVFTGAHEVGHLRLGHWDRPRESCDDFLRIESEADAYAARSLADFQFNMAPVTSTNELPTIANFSTFFQYYRQTGFTNDDNATDCKYQEPEVRLSAVESAYKARLEELMRVTYSAPDFTTANPTSSICYTDGKTWKKPLDD